ncbi:MAG: hypothetical protein IJL61_07300 [Bacteroidales bacterium]|nr:hypothetical protein [Bacteroidales bacterium]
MNGGIAFGSLIFGMMISSVSFIVALIFAVISGVKKKKVIWDVGVCIQAIFFLYLLFVHYFDGSNYLGADSLKITALVSLIIFVSSAVIVHKIPAEKWKPAMWLFSFIIPACFFVVSVSLALDPRPYPHEQLESMAGISLPEYKVTDYEEYSPGGDDWRCTCSMRFMENADLLSFREALEEKLRESVGDSDGSDAYVCWSKDGDIYICKRQFDIEHWVEFQFDLKEKVLSYEYVKI